MEETKTERKYKNSIFTSLFDDKARLLELYNAIEGTSYDDPNLININTLSNVLTLGLHNDISFTIGDKIVVLIEHQASINKNMPLRALMYIGRIYEKIINTRRIHGGGFVKIPKPEFIVLYNGNREYPDDKILKLSEAFEITEERNQLELEVRVLNINKGRNSWLSEKSESLYGYSELVSKVRDLMYQGLTQDEALKKAISYCVERNILVDYLREHSPELLSMLDQDITMEEARELWYEDGYEDGTAKGEEKAAQEIFSLLKQGLTLEEVEAKFSSHSSVSL